MIYLALIIVVVAVLYYQKLIREGKIPRPNGPNGLTTRIVGLVLFAVSLWIFISLTVRGGLNQSNIVITLVAVGYGAWALLKAKRRQETRKAGIDDKGEMKRSLMFLGFAILVAIFLAILYPIIHK